MSGDAPGSCSARTFPEASELPGRSSGRSSRRLGLIVNPVAGLGGRVGLKGSDGPDIQRRALALGAVPEASHRAARALARLAPAAGEIELVAYPGEMGEAAVREAGLVAVVAGSIRPGATTAGDTRRAARDMLDRGVSLLLFAGGDGTARDVYTAIGGALPVLGIPAGVKIHSAVYAVNPAAAGDLALAYLRGEVTRLRELEVMDLDEDAVRRGIVSPGLYGYLSVPFAERLVQGRKTPSPPGEEAAMAAVARAVVSRMAPGRLYVVGPGTTTRAVFAELGLPKTLVGVDVVAGGRLVAADADERRLLALVGARDAGIVVTPIGGQGYIFGRGNQPISPAVIRAVGVSNVLVAGTPGKIASLAGRPLRVDTGDPALDALLAGYLRVIAGPGHTIVYRVSNQ